MLAIPLHTTQHGASKTDKIRPTRRKEAFMARQEQQKLISYVHQAAMHPLTPLLTLAFVLVTAR
jgi:hypothetical protein